MCGNGNGNSDSNGNMVMVIVMVIAVIVIGVLIAIVILVYTVNYQINALGIYLILVLLKGMRLTDKEPRRLLERGERRSFLQTVSLRFLYIRAGMQTKLPVIGAA